MLLSTRLPELCLIRRPGEFGPVLSCSGELDPAMVRALERELELLAPLGHPALTVDLSGCRLTEVDGLLALIQVFRRLSVEQRHLALVLITGTGQTARALEVGGITRIFPAFPDEETAALALRGGVPPGPGPESWVTARAETLDSWREIYAAIDEAPAEEVLRKLTSSQGFCEHADELFQRRAFPAAWRCQLCPLFHAMGGRPVDLGCRSLREPVIEAIQRGDLNGARAQVAEILRTLWELPLPLWEVESPSVSSSTP
jgi:anti-anti-sigma regulatory factor